MMVPDTNPPTRYDADYEYDGVSYWNASGVGVEADPTGLGGLVVRVGRIELTEQEARRLIDALWSAVSVSS